jgi:deazaflavin-dependent oxidoreductase (nitroreductase family)
MPANQDSLREHLSHDREITLTVSGRKSGRDISNPVWFVFEDETLYLLPVRGSETQWYLNVLTKPSIQVAAGDAQRDFHATLITDSKRVSNVVERFRAKYGNGDVKKYYSKFDVAISARI